MAIDYTIILTRQQLLELGLITCANCGYPPNNHFDDGVGPCAHDSNCKQFSEKITVGHVAYSPFKHKLQLLLEKAGGLGLNQRAQRFLNSSAPHHRDREWYKLIEEFTYRKAK